MFMFMYSMGAAAEREPSREARASAVASREGERAAACPCAAKWTRIRYQPNQGQSGGGDRHSFMSFRLYRASAVRATARPLVHTRTHEQPAHTTVITRVPAHISSAPRSIRAARSSSPLQNRTATP